MGDVYITALHLRQGGAENAIVSLANLLAEQGHRVTLLCTYHLGEPAYTVDSRVHIRYLTDKHPNRAEFRAAVASKNPFRILKEGLYAVRTLSAKRRTMRRALAGISHGVVVATHHDHALLLSRYGQAGVGKIAQLSGTFVVVFVRADHDRSIHVLFVFVGGYVHNGIQQEILLQMAVLTQQADGKPSARIRLDVSDHHIQRVGILSRYGSAIVSVVAQIVQSDGIVTGGARNIFHEEIVTAGADIYAVAVTAILPLVEIQTRNAAGIAMDKIGGVPTGLTELHIFQNQIPHVVEKHRGVVAFVGKSVQIAGLFQKSVGLSAVQHYVTDARKDKIVLLVGDTASPVLVSAGIGKHIFIAEILLPQIRVQKRRWWYRRAPLLLFPVPIALFLCED